MVWLIRMDEPAFVKALIGYYIRAVKEAHPEVTVRIGDGSHTAPPSLRRVPLLKVTFNPGLRRRRRYQLMLPDKCHRRNRVAA